MLKVKPGLITAHVVFYNNTYTYLPRAVIYLDWRGVVKFSPRPQYLIWRQARHRSPLHILA